MEGHKDQLLECIPTLNGRLLFSIKPSIPPLIMCIIINKCTWPYMSLLGKNLFYQRMPIHLLFKITTLHVISNLLIINKSITTCNNPFSSSIHTSLFTYYLQWATT
ncbi:hypothetical protein GW17_00016924 [Ensete ventricosum]|nr:hypothetical protein GW17_00016924 [Ensete ventricosum]RZR93298.1 hypothetical protein BHM03_00021764 [Ensete ventricosum]